MRLLLLLSALAIPVLMLSLPGPAARADQGDIEVTLIEAETQYPAGIKFHVRARSSAEIDEVRVYFRKTGRVTAGAYREVDFQPADLESSNSPESGSSITGEATLSTGLGGGYIPPGTEIIYSFEIRDASGAVYRTPDQVAVYNDSRFDWESLTSGPVTVLYYGAGSRERAQLILEAAEEALKRMAPVLGFKPMEPVRIVAFQGFRDLFDALPFRMQALQGRVQTEGMAFSDERVVLIDGLDPSYRGITSHEIVHLEVAEVTGRAENRVPSWLNEGLAEYGNVEPSLEYENALFRGIRLNQVLPLWLLSYSRGTGEDIIRAYGQGLSVVQHLVDNYGESKVAELMEEIQRSLDIDEALETVYGFDQYGLDTEWRIANGLRPLPEPEERSTIRELLPTLTPSPTPPPTETPTPSPTPTSQPTSTPEPTATPRPTPIATALPPSPTPSPQPSPQASVREGDREEGNRPSSPGCSGPHPGNSGAFNGDPAMLAILLAPLAMLTVRHRFRS